MTATLVLSLPAGTTRTLELTQVSLQTTYATEFEQPAQGDLLQSMLARINLTGTISAGTLAAPGIP